MSSCTDRQVEDSGPDFVTVVAGTAAAADIKTIVALIIVVKRGTMRIVIILIMILKR